MSKLDIRIRSKPHTDSFREVIMARRGVLNATTVSECKSETAGLGHLIAGLRQ